MTQCGELEKLQSAALLERSVQVSSSAALKLGSSRTGEAPGRRFWRVAVLVPVRKQTAAAAP